MSKNETGGGEGIEILKNEPFDNFPLLSETIQLINIKAINNSIFIQVENILQGSTHTKFTIWLRKCQP